MSTLLTKYDKRNSGSERAISGEAHTIGEDTANRVFLVEAPLAASGVTITGTPAGGGSFSRVTGTPSAGEFRVTLGGNGQPTGEIEFHADDDAIDITVAYSGTGSTLWARDINRIHTRLTAIPIDVKEYGATGDGVTDDRVAIQAAIAAADAAGGGTVMIPAGTYIVGQSSSNAWCLDLGGTSNVSIVGAGIGVTILKQAASVGASVRLFSCSSAVDHLTLHSMTFDGNNANQTVNEHRHGIFLQNATDVVVRDIESQNFTGDGFYVHSGCQRVLFERCRAKDNDRNGITFGGNSSDIHVLACTSSGNAVGALDSEPKNTDHVDNVTIEHCTLVSGTNHTLTCGGGSNPNENWRVVANQIVSDGNAIRAIRNDGIVFTGNTIKSGVGAYSGIEVYSECTRVLICGNDIVSPNSGANGGVAVIATGADGFTADVAIVGNTIDISGGGTSAGTGVRLQGCRVASVVGNHIIGDGEGSGGGIVVRATYDMVSATIVGNTVSNCPTSGVELVADVGVRRMERAMVCGNVFVDDQDTPTMLRGVRVTGTISNFGELHVGTNTVYGIATHISGSGPFRHGFYTTTPVAQPSLTYSRTGETTAEAQLRTALAALGLVVDSTTP